MIAYFILLHRYPEQFKRMFQAIYSPKNTYLIHIDKSSGAVIAEDIKQFLTPYQGVEILQSRCALWGGYSLVDAELRGMEKLLEMNRDWKFFINLSGQDFPLKSQSYIENYLLNHANTEFLYCNDQQKTRPDTMNRINNFFVEAFQRIFRTNLPRKFPKNAKPYIGTQWKIVTRDFCEFACHNPLAARFKRFYRHSFIADEGFFQTLMMNGFKKGTLVNNDLRAIDWIPDGDIKLRPRTFTLKDASFLSQSPLLFARKFDSLEDNAILSVLEKHILSPLGNIYKPA